MSVSASSHLNDVKKIYRLIFTLLLATFFLISNKAWADVNRTLYGISTDGKLVEISTYSGGHSVRLTLPSNYAPYKSLTYCNNEFYASYQGGKILKFDKAGNITTLLNTGFLAIDGMACYLNEVYLAYATVSNGLGGNEQEAKKVGYYNRQNNTIVPLWDPGTSGAPSSFSIEALASDGGNLYVFTSDYYGFAGSNLYTTSACNGIGVSNISAEPQLPTYFTSNHLHSVNKTLQPIWTVMDGIAISPDLQDPSTGFNLVYGIKGTFIPANGGYNTVAAPSRLFRLYNGNPMQCNSSYPTGLQLIGEGSVNGITDLTWGPVWGIPEIPWVPIKMLLSGGGL